MLPLTGVRVLDLSRLLPGPYCSQMLADFGAEVIKIEDVDQGDYLRWFPPMTEEYSALFYSVNRNKQSLTLDLKKEEGRQILRKLAETGDVLLEGFRPGVMTRLGLGYEDLKKINPRLIYCCITGYGQDGPYRDIVGHDVNYLSLAGITSLIGHGGEKPGLSDVQIADIGGGALMGVIAILLALQAREKTGFGQLCDVSMLDGVVSWLPFVAARLMPGGEFPERGAGLLGGGYACYNIYETSDGKFVSLGAIEGKFWAAFCRKVGREDLIPVQLEVPRQPLIKAELTDLFKRKTRQEWVDFLADAEICFTPVNSFAEATTDPQILHRGMLYHVETGGGKVLQTGVPIKLSETPGITGHKFPGHGEHTSDILRSLGYDAEQIRRLKDGGVI